ncbi:MAG: amidohydrolase [Actinobacteria bacterium]|nr:amidohydrolase [Actinomycetota bacterium]
MRIDCDVHGRPPTMAELMPHLDPYWAAYAEEAGIGAPAGIVAVYPPGAATTGDPEGGASLEALREHLDRQQAAHAVLNCVYGLEGLRNLDFASAVASAVNEWLMAEWLDRDPRLRAGIVVKAEDAAGAAAEIERRRGDERFLQVLLPARSERPYGDRSYLPLLEAASEAGLPVAIHFGGFTGNPPTPIGWPSYYIEEYVGMAHAFEAQLTSLVASGAFEQLPDLRVVFVESGFAWLPSAMWRLDKEWRGLWREIPWVKRLPSETIRERVSVTLQPIDPPPQRERLAQVIEQIDCERMLLFSSDFPHAHDRSFEQAFEGILDPGLERAIAADNARALYRL